MILCKRISQQLNLNLPHTDSCHTTSRDLEKNKSKILLPKETNKSLMLRWHKRINAQRNINGPSKIYQILNINSITKLNSKINKNKPWLNTVMPTYKRDKKKMQELYWGVEKLISLLNELNADLFKDELKKL